MIIDEEINGLIFVEQRTYYIYRNEEDRSKDCPMVTTSNLDFFNSYKNKRSNKMDKEFFKAYCNVVKIPFNIATKIIDGRYKPYLSAIDNLYYSGELWDAKQKALTSAVSNYSISEIMGKLCKK